MCVSGKCLKFDGVTNYVDAGSNSVFNLGGGDFTTELWLKLNSYNASWVTGVIGNFDGNTTGWELEVYGALGGSSNQGKLGLRFNNSTGSFWGTTQLSLNTWYHISMVYTSSNTIVKFYINGTTSNADSGSVPGYLSPTVSMKIGKRHDGYLANGFIDDVKIYPYARTADQIKADYNSRGSLSGTSVQVGNQSAWMTNGLVGYWKIQAGTEIQHH
jgi:hypothetical protein